MSALQRAFNARVRFMARLERYMRVFLTNKTIILILLLLLMFTLLQPGQPYYFLRNIQCGVSQIYILFVLLTIIYIRSVEATKRALFERGTVRDYIFSIPRFLKPYWCCAVLSIDICVAMVTTQIQTFERYISYNSKL